MTRNQQALMIMTWAIPYHGLSPEDSQVIAERVLDRYDGDLSDAIPSEVIHAYFEEYYRASQEEGMEPVDAPRWEDYGFVRPPQLQQNNTVAYLSDGTSVMAQNLAVVLSDMQATNAEDPYGDQFVGVNADGSLSLQSGGVVPPLSGSARKKIWVAIFCNPTATTQEEIDAMVLSPPPLPEEPNVIEQRAIDAYDAIFMKANEIAEVINQDLANNETPHFH